MKHLHIDFETYSEIDLRLVGHYRYAMHPSTEGLMVAWGLDHKPGSRRAKVHDLYGRKKLPKPLKEAILNPKYIKWAHNASFEIAILRHVYGLDIDLRQWRCSMVTAYYNSLPGALDMAGRVAGIPEDMLKSTVEGKKQISWFCKPCKKTKRYPYTRHRALDFNDRWHKFLEYCRQDVEAERALVRQLHAAGGAVPQQEWDLWVLDQTINDRGLPIDYEMAESAVQTVQTYIERLMVEARELTGMENPNSTSQLKTWLGEQGIHTETVAKDWISDQLNSELEPDVRRMLEIRRRTALSSVKKYEKMLAMATPEDPRMRGTFQFYGAQRTGRWAGRGPQPHNFPSRGVEARPEVLGPLRDAVRERDVDFIPYLVGSLAEGLKYNLRPTIAAPKGFKFVVADLSSIETVKTAWAAHCEPLLNVLRDNRCPYKEFAVKMFNEPYEAITKKQRGEAKPPVLGCGYGLGPGKHEHDVEKDDGSIMTIDASGLIGYAEDFGMELSLERSKYLVDLYRKSYPEVPKFWRALEAAFSGVILDHSSEFRIGGFEIYYETPALRVVLPSERELIYVGPALRKKRHEYKKKNGETVHKWRNQITYMNFHNTSRAWRPTTTFGGKITENLVQAIARDYLATGMQRAEENGFEIVGHVHDEIIALVPVTDNTLTVDLLCQCMAENPSWCPGSPVRAEGWEGDFYRKD